MMSMLKVVKCLVFDRKVGKVAQKRTLSKNSCDLAHLINILTELIDIPPMVFIFSKENGTFLAIELDLLPCETEYIDLNL